MAGDDGTQHDGIVTQPSTNNRPPGTRSDSQRFFTWVRELRIARDTDEKWLAGVCSGIARRLDVDPLLIRACLVMLGILWGFGLGLYLLAWALLPDEKDEILAESSAEHGQGLGIALIVVGLLMVGGSSATRQNGLGWLWVPLVLLAVYLYHRKQHRGSTGDNAPPPTPGPAAPVPPETTASTAEGTSAAATTRSAQEDNGFPPYQGVYEAPQTTRPPRPPRVGRRSANPWTSLVTLVLAGTTFGIVTHRASTFTWSDRPAVLGGAAALVILSLALLTRGMLGLRAGLTAVATVVSAGAVVIAAVLPAGIIIPDGTWGDQTWRPTNLSTTNFQMAGGSGVLDLRGLPLSDLSGQRLTVAQGVGSLRVIVPPGIAVDINGTVAGGQLCVEPGAQCQSSHRQIARHVLIGEEPARLHVDARLSLGNLTIEKAK